MKEKISIIGGAGFLGTKLSEILKKKDFNFNLYDINDKQETIKKIDVESINSLERLKNSTTIINLAAVHRDDIKPISKYDDVNVGGALNICSIAEKYEIKKIIFISSVAIYGNADLNTDESGEPNFFNHYGRTKYEAELIYKKWQKDDPKNRVLTIIRPTVIFGEGNRGHVYNLLNQIYKKKFIMIGKGTNKKSMAYVDNVAEFIIYALKQNNNNLSIYNYVDKPDFTMNELVLHAKKKLFRSSSIGLRIPLFFGLLGGYLFDFVSLLFRKSLPISSIRVKKFVSDSSFTSRVELSSFKPPFKLKEALDRTLTYEFIEDNSNKKVFYTE